MAGMPIPNGLTLFIMVGNEAAMLAGNIVTSVSDHVDEDEREAIGCFALVDSEFDEEKAAVDGVFYRYGPTGLADFAADVASQKLEDMNIRLDKLDVRFIDLNRVNCVLVADASGSVSLDAVASIAKRIRLQTDRLSMRCDVFLCMLTDFRQFGRQHEWITRDNGLNPELNVFGKVLLLSNKELQGTMGTRIEQSMRNAIAPTLLLMINRYELDNGTRLYTAAYNQNGGTSSDVLELKRHLAAESLNGYFANPSHFDAAGVWAFLSTADFDFRSGKTVAERAANAAERYLPTLETIAASADLDSKFFDPVAHVQAFDRLNADAMYRLEDAAARWAEAVSDKLNDNLYPDALLYQIGEESPLYKEVLSEWRESNAIRKNAKQSDIRSRLGYADEKKGLFAKAYNHNLQMLDKIVSSYRIICRERYVNCILTCLTTQLPRLREKLQESIELRTDILNAYMLERNKLDVLMDAGVCGKAGEELKQRYNRTPVDELNTFLQFSERLYQPEGGKYWKKLFREFTATGKDIEKFSEAFLRGKDGISLLAGVKKLADNVSPLIPDYPPELPALQPPSNHYLLHTSIADRISPDPAYMVHSVPGDVLEHIALYRIDSDFSTLLKLKLFAQGSYIGQGSVVRSIGRAGRRRTDISSADPLSENPWKITLKQVGDRVCVSWNFSNHETLYDIIVNGETIDTVSHKEFLAGGMSYTIPARYVRGKTLRVTLRNEDEQSEASLTLTSEPISAYVRPSSVRAKLGDVELVRCTADGPNVNGALCLVIMQGTQAFRVPAAPDGNGNIGPLWLPEGYSSIELEELTD